MTQPKHTPGPWRLHFDQHGYTGEIHGSPEDGCIADWVEEPNAHLIAAAPELLEALKAVEYQLGGESSAVKKRFADVRAKARAAIAKVEGRKT